MPVEGERWKRLESIYHAALEREPEARRGFIANACPDDKQLCLEIESLLGLDADATGLFDRPAWEALTASFEHTKERPLPPGTQLGSYTVESLIGAGGMGMVYEAEDVKLHRHVALKSLPEAFSNEKQAVDRLWREARAASALNHPNIATIHGIEEFEGRTFIVMELLEGQSLKQLIGGKPVDRKTLMDAAIQITDGLEAAHSKGIIHRDIKPANLFLTSRGQVKILDFGVAKFQAAEPAKPAVAAGTAEGVATFTNASLTSTGALVGTVAYMSPEQVSGMELDTRTDLFSSGAVLYEMATGVAPFRGDTLALIRHSILNYSPASPARANPSVSPKLDRIIGKALEKDRERRYQSAADMRADLRRLVEAEARAKRRRATLMVASVMLVLAAVALWSFWNRPQPEPTVVERQITANPPENWVVGGGISPDGRTIAYRDQTGVYIRSLDSGETHVVVLEPEFQNSIWGLSWLPDGKRLLARVPAASGGSGSDFWTISVNGDPAPQRAWRSATDVSISPDGQSIALLRDHREPSQQPPGIWIAPINGGSEQLLRAKGKTDDWLYSPVWSPDGRWLAYGHTWKTKAGFNTSIEVQPAAGGSAKTIVTGSSLPRRALICNVDATGLCLSWSPDWRVMFTVGPPSWAAAEDIEYSLWQIPTGMGTAEPAGKPHRLAHWTDFGPGDLTVTADGKHLSFVKTKEWIDVYLADLGKKKMLSPRRFTLDNRGSYANAWTPDSQAILLSSDRTLKRGIFRQPINSQIASPMISAPGEDCENAAMTPDGRWVLFRESERVRPGTSSGPVRLMRRATDGGPSEKVLEEPSDLNWGYGCGVKPHSRCILWQTEGSEVVLYALDPMRGKESALRKFERPNWESGAADWKISVSPDGSRLAYPTEARQIKIVSLKEPTWTKEISFGPGPQRPQSIAWAADGKGLFSILATDLL